MPYTLSDDAAWLIGVQLLDGVGAGIFGAITPLVAAGLMRGTRRLRRTPTAPSCPTSCARDGVPTCYGSISHLRGPLRAQASISAPLDVRVFQ